jgi:hypothetical protein
MTILTVINLVTVKSSIALNAVLLYVIHPQDMSSQWVAKMFSLGVAKT